MEREVGKKLALERGCCGRFLLMVGHDAAGIEFSFFFFAEGDECRIIGCLRSGGGWLFFPVAAATPVAAAVPTDVALRSFFRHRVPGIPNLIDFASDHITFFQYIFFDLLFFIQ